MKDFQEKTRFKGSDPDNFVENVFDKESKFESNWKNNLWIQINDVPDFDKVWIEFSRHFKNYDNYIKK